MIPLRRRWAVVSERAVGEVWRYRTFRAARVEAHRRNARAVSGNPWRVISL